MKRKLLKGLSFFVILGLFMTFTSCNSGSKSNTDSSVSKIKSTSEMVQGVFEFVPPIQGYAIYLDNRYLVMIGMSDNTMSCKGGKSEISGDTITDIKLFSTNPNEVGNTQPWIAEMLQGDTLKATLFNKDGSTMVNVKMVKKVNPTDEMRSQMKDIEGFYQYAAPYRGLSTMLGGYYIYLHGLPDEEMRANAGTYKVDKDKTTCKISFSTNPQLIGVESDWIKKSVIGNTLTWANIDDKGEITSTGQSVRPE